MEFPQKIKKQARKLSGFKCCLCHENDVMEIHHIDPAKGDGLDNAAPLCSNCHNLYGGDPIKRPFIIQSKDFWFEHIRNTYDTREKEIKILENIEEKAEKIDDKTERLALMTPIIVDMHTKVNKMWDYYQKKDYKGVTNIMSDVSSATSTVTSGSVILSSIDKVNPIICPMCKAPVLYPIDQCTNCGYPL